jgi:hypothetical protein
MRQIFIPLAFVILAGCQGTNGKALKAAERFQSAAEKCMLSVRDAGLVYENAPTCKALEGKHKAYIDARDLTTKAPMQEQFVMESGYRMAWGARAMSAAKDPTLSLWVN